jgi:Replication-relaxation
MNAAKANRDGLPDRSREAVLESCYRHRLLSTSQVRTLHFPAHTLRQAQHVLASLVASGQVASARNNRNDEAVWYVTDGGAQLLESAGYVSIRRHRVTADSARGPLREHTLGVNAVGVAFVVAARAHGDECSTADWSHEHAFRVSERRGGQGGDMLVTDAILHYTLCDRDEEWPLVRFVELDRGTESVGRLAEKLRDYALLHAYRPKARRGAAQNGPPSRGWQDRFIVFPKVLVVLTGRDQATLVRRRNTLLHLCSADRVMSRSEVVITITTLAELCDRGPFAPIFWSPNLEGPVDLVGDGPKPGQQQPLELGLAPTHPVNSPAAPSTAAGERPPRPRVAGVPVSQLQLITPKA